MPHVCLWKLMLAQTLANIRSSNSALLRKPWSALGFLSLAWELGHPHDTYSRLRATNICRGRCPTVLWLCIRRPVQGGPALHGTQRLVDGACAASPKGCPDCRWGYGVARDELYGRIWGNPWRIRGIQGLTGEIQEEPWKTVENPWFSYVFPHPLVEVLFFP